MTDIGKILGQMLVAVGLTIVAMLVIITILEVRPSCWLSRTPFLCERIYQMEAKL